MGFSGIARRSSPPRTARWRALAAVDRACDQPFPVPLSPVTSTDRVRHARPLSILETARIDGAGKAAIPSRSSSRLAVVTRLRDDRAVVTDHQRGAFSSSATRSSEYLDARDVP